MIISVAARGELCPAELAVVGFLSGVSAHMNLKVALLKESKPTIIAPVIRYLVEMGIFLMKP